MIIAVGLIAGLVVGFIAVSLDFYPWADWQWWAIIIPATILYVAVTK